MLNHKDFDTIQSVTRKLNYKAANDYNHKQLKNIVKTLNSQEKKIYTKYYFDFNTGKMQALVKNQEENVLRFKKAVKFILIGFVLISIAILSGCSSTVKTEYVELPPVIKKEFVFLKCKVPSELLTTNKIKIEKEKAFEILQKIAQETNDRKRKIEIIKSIECIEEI